MSASLQTFKESGSRSPLDPRVSIFAILTVSAVMIGGGLDGVHFVPRLFCCILPLLFLLMIRRYRFVAVYTTLYVIAMLLEGAIFQMTSGIANMIVVILAGVISRFLAPIVMGVLCDAEHDCF